MRKAKKLMNETGNSRVYKMAKREVDLLLKCPICSPHRECNRRKFGVNNNWKKYRLTKWKQN
jgi:hypothetical protein